MLTPSDDRAIDLDELIAKGDAERALWAEADSAFRADPEFAIEIAGAARVAAQKEARIDAKERAGLASADPAEVARVQKRIRERQWRRNGVLAAMRAYDAI